MYWSLPFEGVPFVIVASLFLSMEIDHVVVPPSNDTFLAADEPNSFPSALASVQAPSLPPSVKTVTLLPSSRVIASFSIVTVSAFKNLSLASPAATFLSVQTIRSSTPSVKTEASVTSVNASLEIGAGAALTVAVRATSTSLAPSVAFRTAFAAYARASVALKVTSSLSPLMAAVKAALSSPVTSTLSVAFSVTETAASFLTPSVASSMVRVPHAREVGLTVITGLTVAFLTVTTQVSLISLATAKIFTSPSATPVTTPLASTVAIASSFEPHTSASLPSRVAESVTVSPTSISAVFGSTVRVVVGVITVSPKVIAMDLMYIAFAVFSN